MPDDEHKPYPPPTSVTTVLACLGGYYAAWFLLQMMFQQTGMLLLSGGDLPGVIIPLAVIFNVLAAAGLTAFHLVYAEPGLARRPAFRTALIVISLTIGTILFVSTRNTGAHITIQILSTGNLLVLACLVGPWLCLALKRPSEIVLLAAFVLMIDGISVLAGPTRVISDMLKPYYKGGMKGPVPLSDVLILKTAVPGLAQAMPVFGVSDWVMLVFFAAACMKFNIRDNLLGEGLDEMVRKRRVSGLFLPVTGAGLIIAVIAAQGLGLFLPALPFMALVLIFYLTARFPETRRLDSRDWIAAAILTMVIGAAVAFAFHFRG
jgi:hypothetical protein